MKLLTLSEQNVRELLPYETCVELMADALAALARGEAFQPLRHIVRPPGAPGVLGLMPAWRSVPRPAFGLKAVGVFAANRHHGLDTHQGAVMLFSGETGELLAIANASAVTSIRTAAVSVLATRVLARPDAEHMALLGTGAQARAHLEAFDETWPLARVRVAGRSPDEAERFVASFGGRLRTPLEAVASAERAVRGASLVVTTTSSPAPILEREWIAPGAHINLVGSSVRTDREIDGATLAAAAFFVDRRESTLAESGDYLLAVAEGAIPGPGHIRAELGEVLTGGHPGRGGAQEITVFKSLGLAIEDLAAVEYLFHIACERGAGTWVDF